MNVRLQAFAMVVSLDGVTKTVNALRLHW